MEINEELLSSISKNKIRNINLINFMKTYPIVKVEQEGDSILVKGISDQEWVYINSESEYEFKKLMKKLNDNEKYFVIQEDWMLPIIIENRELDWKLSCRKLYFPLGKDLPENKNCFEGLFVDEALYIYDNYEYKEFTSVDYIKERIEKGIGLGIHEDGKLVAWIITQDDGAMGFLTVLPEYRRKGYGFELTLAMIKRVRDAGDLPFVHIEEDNQKSMNLALKMGYVKDSLIHWIKLK